MFKPIITQCNLGIESLKQMSVFTDLSDIREESAPVVSTESQFGLLGGMFNRHPKIGSEINPTKLRYSDDDLQKVIKIMRSTVLNSDWAQKAKFRTGNSKAPALFDCFAVDGKFDVSDSVQFIQNALRTQRSAYEEFTKVLVENAKARMAIHADLQQRWAGIAPSNKAAAVEDALSKIFEANNLAKVFPNYVKSSITVGASCRMVPGSQYPVATFYKNVVRQLPLITPDQLQDVAELIIEMCEICIECETPTMMIYKAAYQHLSQWNKSDQVLMWLYQNDQSLFMSYATLIHWEEELQWTPGKITQEFTALRILISWIIDSVHE